MGLGHWTDVFDVFDVCHSAAPRIAGLASEDYELAVSDLEGFFEVMMTMIYAPGKAYERYGQEIAGLGDLQGFLLGRFSVLSVRWDYTRFKTSRDEFGAVRIISLRMLRRRD